MGELSSRANTDGVLGWMLIAGMGWVRCTAGAVRGLEGRFGG
jgi:hypothetical protein